MEIGFSNKGFISAAADGSSNLLPDTKEDFSILYCTSSFLIPAQLLEIQAINSIATNSTSTNIGRYIP
jgi:hypothetical protein